MDRFNSAASFAISMSSHRAFASSMARVRASARFSISLDRRVAVLPASVRLLPAFVRSPCHKTITGLAKRESLHCLKQLPKQCGIVAPVESEGKFVDVERQIFARDVMEAAHDAAFKQAPERFNRLCVNRAGHVLMFGMIDRFMDETMRAKMAIAGVFIGHDHLRSGGYRFFDEISHRRESHFINGASNDAALARDCANDGHVAVSDARSRAALLL